MYCKIFASLYQGTLRGHSDEILVFTNLLAHADKDGFVDKHFKAIAEETGLDLERVKLAIEYLESSDPDSRSPEEEGARLIRLDDHRNWGWRVVNYVKYRQIRNADDRREQNRIAQERFRKVRQNKQHNYSKQNKPRSAHAEAEAYADNSSCSTKPPAHAELETTNERTTTTTTELIEELTRKKTEVADELRDLDLAIMEPFEAMAVLQREHPDIDVWNEWRRLKKVSHDNGTKPTWRGFQGWLRKASPVAKIPRKGSVASEVIPVVSPEREAESRANAIRTLKEWRERGATPTGIKNQLNGQGGPFPLKETA